MTTFRPDVGGFRSCTHAEFETCTTTALATIGDCGVQVRGDAGVTVIACPNELIPSPVWARRSSISRRVWSWSRLSYCCGACGNLIGIAWGRPMLPLSGREHPEPRYAETPQPRDDLVDSHANVARREAQVRRVSCLNRPDRLLHLVRKARAEERHRERAELVAVVE